MRAYADLRFACMGSDFRVVVEEGPDVHRIATHARRLLERFDRALTRFDESSELSRLNADRRTTVAVSPMLCAVVDAAIRASRITGGLIDCTLTDAIEQAGYRTSRRGETPIELRQALAAAPPRVPARPDPLRSWETIRTDRSACSISREPGIRIDLGGVAKGYAADAAARLLRGGGARRFFVDCAGDIAIESGDAGAYEIAVEAAFGGEIAATIPLARGGIATSGIDRRIWRGPDGIPAHHLLDPSTGRPAWTGLVSVTAVGVSALEAETSAKTALLAGAEAAREMLARHGGVIVHDDGAVELLAAQREPVAA